MPYVLIRPQHAENFNRGLCRLLRPTNLRGPDYVTDFYCEMLFHSSGEWAALNLPDVDTVPIHVAADGSELAQVLMVFVQDGAITAEELAGIGGAVGANGGQEVRIADFIPPSWSANVKTREEMEADGWFPEEAGP